MTCKLNPFLGLGLHELAAPVQTSDSFRFQLSRAKEQIELIRSSLEELVKVTLAKAPERQTGFCLDRKGQDPPLTHEEDKWERAMYRKWGPDGHDEYVSICRSIQTYQYPLRASQKDSHWGQIDLLGIGSDFLPVPNELKTAITRESPLRMLVEVAAYGLALMKAWPTLKDHWIDALSHSGKSRRDWPLRLDGITVIGAAPEQYWDRCLGKIPGTAARKFPPDAWPDFWRLVDDFRKKGVDTHFVAIAGELRNLTGARVLPLRSVTLKP
jgi:hypothetical protein